MSEELYRNYDEERAYGVDNVRGILYGLSFSLSFFAVIGGISFGVSKAFGA